MTRLERERLAAEYVRLHNAASLEYKAAFKAVGARLWPMDNAHLLKPANQSALAENISDRWTPKLPRPLTVLDSYPDVTTKQRQQLIAAVDAIHAKYAALWSAFVKRKQAKDSLPRFAAFVAALLAWYEAHTAQEEVERNQASGYNLLRYRPKPKAF